MAEVPQLLILEMVVQVQQVHFQALLSHMLVEAAEVAMSLVVHTVLEVQEAVAMVIPQ
jgi:hypothetical protein